MIGDSDVLISQQAAIRLANRLIKDGLPYDALSSNTLIAYNGAILDYRTELSKCQSYNHHYLDTNSKNLR